jgi:hypothetical protein
MSDKTIVAAIKNRMTARQQRAIIVGGPKLEEKCRLGK